MIIWRIMQVAGEIMVKNGGRIIAEPGGSIADNLAELTPRRSRSYPDYCTRCGSS